MRAVLEQPRRQPVLCSHVSAHIDQMQPAAGAQHPENLGRRFNFRVAIEVMQHHRRQHPVEFAVSVGQPLRVALLEANAGQAARLSLGALARQRVGVGSDHLGTGMSPFGAECEIASTTADFQDALVLGEFGLIDQHVDALGGSRTGGSTGRSREGMRRARQQEGNHVDDISSRIHSGPLFTA